MSEHGGPNIAPMYVLIGDESLRIQEAEASVMSQAFAGGKPGFNLATYVASQGAESAMDVARTLPMMAKKRVVVIREMEKASVALLDALLEYAENPNPSTVLVLCGKKFPEAVGGVHRGRRLENKVNKVGEVRRFRSKDQNPVGFVMDEARRLGCSIERPIARLMVEIVGGDLGRLRGEVEKAAAYLGANGEIDGDVVEQVCSVVGEAVVWALTDAVVSRDRNRGLAVAHRMLEEAPPTDRVSYRLLALIAWQLRQLMELQVSVQRGGPLPKSWQRVPSSKLRAARELVSRSPMRPAEVFEALANANRQFNRSRAGDRRVFEALIMELTNN